MIIIMMVMALKMIRHRLLDFSGDIDDFDFDFSLTHHKTVFYHSCNYN